MVNWNFHLTVSKILNLTRIGCLGAVCLTQAWMMRKFVHFQLKKWRERVKDQIPEKKSTNPKKKRTKKEPGKSQWCKFFKLLLGQMFLYQMYHLHLSILWNRKISVFGHADNIGNIIVSSNIRISSQIPYC